VDCVVLEGRRRLGGRAHTRRFGDAHFDLGCSWIHEPVGNPMARFAQQAGVGRSNADLELDLATVRFFDGFSDGDVPLPQALAAFTHAVTFEGQAADLAQELGPDASVRDGAIEYLDRRGLTGASRRRAAFIQRLFAELGDNFRWGRISLGYWGNYESPYLGVGQGDFPEGGYIRLVRAMAGNTDVRLRHRVTSIERGAHGVRVHARVRGRHGGHRVRFRGSHVLVTVPLGVLKHGDIGFTPRLPAAKREVIGRIGFGRFEKVAMLFEEPFWQGGVHTHIAHLSDRVPFEAPLFIDMQHLLGFPALVCTNGGRGAARVERMTETETLDLTLGVLRRVLGRAIPRPVEFAVTNWRHDRFSRGAYSTVLVGGALSDLDGLATPVGGRLLFAGEATNSARLGYADGAMTSGIREAKRLLQQPSVQLSAH
jgi:monoamine oxidase